MRSYVLTHVNDSALLRDLDALTSQERGAMASVVAHLAEVDARRLYLPAGYPSMYEYCLGRLHWSEQAALKRLQAARAARRFPVLFDALAAGRLHLSAVVLLAPHLTPENADELLAAAVHRTKIEIETLLARRFPRPDLPARIRALPPATSLPELRSQGTVPYTDPQPLPGTVSTGDDTIPGDSANHRGHRLAGHAQGSQPAPLAPERFAIQFTISKDTYDKLRHVQELLSHQLPSGDLAQVFDRALDALAREVEKRKFAATAMPRPRARRAADSARSGSANPRYIPASVKRTVWERDGGRCTFVNAAGERCAARRFLEYDHIEPVARGGRATVHGVRVLCRGHNQYEAERRFGAGFMRAKRERAWLSQPPPPDQVREVMAALRALGVRAGEARRAVADSAALGGVTVEEQLRAALMFVCPKPIAASRHSPRVSRDETAQEGRSHSLP